MFTVQVLYPSYIVQVQDYYFSTFLRLQALVWLVLAFRVCFATDCDELFAVDSEYQANMGIELKSCPISPNDVGDLSQALEMVQLDSSADKTLRVKTDENKPFLDLEFSWKGIPHSDGQVLFLEDGCRPFFLFRLFNSQVSIISGDLKVIDKPGSLTVRFRVADAGNYSIQGWFYNKPFTSLEEMVIDVQVSATLNDIVSEENLHLCTGLDLPGRWVYDENWQNIPLAGYPDINPNFTPNSFIGVNQHTKSGVLKYLEQSAESLSFRWQPYCCKFRIFRNVTSEISAHSCIKNKWIHLQGDSLSRFMYFDLFSGISGEIVEALLYHHSLISYICRGA